MPVAASVRLGASTKILHPDLVNIYGCSIGDETTVGPFVEIQADVVVGARCKVSSHSFLCSGTVIEDEVFIGHGVMFTNDRHPRAIGPGGHLKGGDDWVREPVVVRRGASIGSGAVILPGVEVGAGAMVGAGAVVVHDVPAGKAVAGSPARVVGPAQDGVA